MPMPPIQQGPPGMQPIQQGPPGMQPMAAPPSAALPPQLGGQGAISPEELAKTLTPEQQQQVGSLPPEAQAAFWEAMSKDHAARLGSAEADMARADAIRQQKGPQGSVAGGVYQAASPLQHIASALRGRQANQDFTTATGARDDAIADRESSALSLSEMLRKRSGM